MNDDNVWLGRNVRLAPGVVLDASRGPIVLADDATVGANAVLSGPCSVGHHATVHPLAHVRGGTTIGPLCKVGGEVLQRDLPGHSNKAHDGFVGDSYVGQWANLGAGTTTSNLKNTYGEISMCVAGQTVKTGRRFLGALIGDHAKTGIGTRLMAGTYVGYGSSVALSRPVPKVVPSFTFVTDDGAEPYRLDKAAEVMTQVFARRGRTWTAEDDAMNRHVAETAKVRLRPIGPSKRLHANGTLCRPALASDPCLRSTPHADVRSQVASERCCRTVIDRPAADAATIPGLDRSFTVMRWGKRPRMRPRGAAHRVSLRA